MVSRATIILTFHWRNQDHEQSIRKVRKNYEKVSFTRTYFSKNMRVSFTVIKLTERT